MEQSALFKFQQKILKMIEMVCNSQIFTPNALRKLKTLKDYCYESLDVPKSNITDHNAIIAHLYKNYLDIVSESPADLNHTTIEINNNVQINSDDEPAVNFLKEFETSIKNKISEFVCGSFIHGSMSTNDYTGFSDVDAGLIVKDEVMLNPILLRKFEKNIRETLKNILRFDNLQHHGFFIIPEGFLTCYPEDYLPIEVFKYARALNGTMRLNIKSHRSTEQAKKNFMKMASIFAESKFRKPRNLYEAKHILSQFMLLPALCLQAKGEYVYKKFSFDMVRKEFSDTWWAMDEVSEIRKDWIRPKSKLFNTLLDTLPNPWMASLIYRKSDWRIPDWLLRKLTPKLYQSMYTLSWKMLTTIS